MAEYTVSPTSLTFVVFRDGPPTQLSQQLTISDEAASLAVDPAVAGLTVPAASVDGVAFAVTVDQRDIPKGFPRRYETTITASGALDDTDIPVTILVKPGGPPKP